MTDLDPTSRASSGHAAAADEPNDTDRDDARERFLRARLDDVRRPLTRSERHATQRELREIAARRDAQAHRGAEPEHAAEISLPAGTTDLATLLAIQCGVLHTGHALAAHVRLDAPVFESSANARVAAARLPPIAPASIPEVDLSTPVTHLITREQVVIERGAIARALGSNVLRTPSLYALADRRLTLRYEQLGERLTQIEAADERAKSGAPAPTRAGASNGAPQSVSASRASSRRRSAMARRTTRRITWCPTRSCARARSFERR